MYLWWDKIVERVKRVNARKTLFTTCRTLTTYGNQDLKTWHWSTWKHENKDGISKKNIFIACIIIKLYSSRIVCGFQAHLILHILTWMHLTWESVFNWKVIGVWKNVGWNITTGGRAYCKSKYIYHYSAAKQSYIPVWKLGQPLINTTKSTTPCFKFNGDIHVVISVACDNHLASAEPRVRSLTNISNKNFIPMPSYWSYLILSFKFML